MRPLNSNELKQKHLHARVWKVLPQYSSITQTTRDGDGDVGNSDYYVPLPRIAGRTYFSFDKTFSDTVTTQDVYQATACRDIVTSVVSTGRHGTIFAYGQTSSGKTYTMQGPLPELSSSLSSSSSLASSSSSSSSRQSPINNHNTSNSRNIDVATTATATATTAAAAAAAGTVGIVQLAARDIFDHVQNTPQRQFQVVASYLEIYNEEVRDLLFGGGGSSTDGSANNKKASSASAAVLQIREDPLRGVFVQDVQEQVVTNYQELLAVLARGEGCRKVAATQSYHFSHYRYQQSSSSSSSSMPQEESWQRRRG
jgi:centromeric protein E